METKKPETPKLLDNFKPINSSNLVAAAYDPETKLTQVEFKNGVYQYEGLNADEFAQFEATFQTKDSSGGFFHDKIKKLPFVKVK